MNFVLFLSLFLVTNLYANDGLQGSCSDLKSAISAGLVQVETADKNSYAAYAGDSIKYYIAGSVDENGMMSFAIRTKNSEGKHFQPYFRAKELFTAMMEHFGGRVVSVEDHWIGSRDGSPSTNLDLFEQALNQGKTEKEAALDTWTGQRMLDYGFTKVQSVEVDRNPYQQITGVKAVFLKPISN